MNEQRQGYQTTEFWIVVMLIALAGLNGTEYVNIPWNYFFEIYGMATGLGGVYVAARTFTKRGEKAAPPSTPEK